jgi:hypothetical protein
MNNSEINKIAPTLSAVKRENNFVVPENYFECLINNIEHQLLIRKQNVFDTPINYFDSLPDSLNQLILIEKKESLSIPHGYFELLEKKLSLTENRDKSKLFDTPKDYFESLPQIIQHKIYNEKESKKWFVPEINYRYAFATIAACIFLLSGITYFIRPSNNLLPVADLVTKKVNPKSNSVRIINLRDGIQVKVSEKTKNEIETHISEQLILNIDESLLIEELAVNTQQDLGVKNQNSNNEIKDFLIENNLDESLLIDAVN